jgi:hypothetical protein
MRRRKGDKKLAEGLELEGYAEAGTAAAFEALPPDVAESPHCVRCGSPIAHVFLTSKGPIGGDCLATLTGDPATRQLGRKLTKALDRVMRYREVTGLKVERGFRDYTVSAISIDRNDYDSWTGEFGTKSDYLISFKEAQLPVVTALVAHAAEVQDLELEQ